MLPAAVDSQQSIFPHWRPELHFLLGHLGAAGFARHPSPPDALDWEYVLATASRHAVLPLLFRSISKSGQASMPETIMDRMRHDCSVISRRNFIFAHELLRVLTHLSDHGIAAVAYKGAPLAEMAYGDLSLRQFGDLDILVKAADVFRAKNLLEDLGYQARFIHGRRPLSALTAAQTGTFFKYLFEFEMERKDGLLIDLHWQLAPRQYPFRPDTGPLWKRIEMVAFAGRRISSFSREDLILILCLHGAKDRWKKLIWIIDLAQIMRIDRPLDWDVISSRAKGAHMELPLLLGIRLVEEVFGPQLASAMDRPNHSRDRITRLARRVLEQLFRENDRAERFPIRSLHLGLCRDLSDKLSYSWQALFVPRVADWGVVRLPGWLYPLYYVLRPFRVLASWAWNSIRRWTKEAK